MGVLPQLSSCGAVMVGSSNTFSDVRWWLVSMGPRAVLSQSFFVWLRRFWQGWWWSGGNPVGGCRELIQDARAALIQIFAPCLAAPSLVKVSTLSSEYSSVPQVGTFRDKGRASCVVTVFAFHLFRQVLHGFGAHVGDVHWRLGMGAYIKVITLV